MLRDIIRDRPHLFLGSRLRRLAEHMQSDVALVAQRAGIPIQPGQFPLLMAIDEQGPMTIGDLALSLQISQPAITKTAARLVEAGLAAVTRSAADRRQRTLSLTPRGQQALDRSRHDVGPLVEGAVKDVIGDLSGPLVDQISVIEERMASCSLSNRAWLASARSLTPATEADVPAIVAMMNRAYRGTGEAASWNSEADLIGGDRTTEAFLRADMAAKPHATQLRWSLPEDPALLGCVWLEPMGRDVWYLGSLTVDPRRQKLGLGRRLLAASEDWVRRRAGTEIRMTVINLRANLLEWYYRRGYEPSGETMPFPYHDHRFGIAKRDDLHFVVLRKQIA